MNVNSINSVAFTGVAKTKKGNEYNQTNGGKITGIALGATAGGYIALGARTAVKQAIENGEFENIFNTVVESSLKKEDTVTKTIFNAIKPHIQKEGALRFGKYSVIGGLVLAAVAIVFGLGAGTIGDALVNKIKRNKADKQAQQA